MMVDTIIHEEGPIQTFYYYAHLIHLAVEQPIVYKAGICLFVLMFLIVIALHADGDSYAREEDEDDDDAHVSTKSHLDKSMHIKKHIRNHGDAE